MLGAQHVEVHAGLPVVEEGLQPARRPKDQLLPAVRAGDGGKKPLPLTTIAEAVVALLGRDQQTMLDNARAARDSRIADVATVGDAVAACTQGWARLPWRSVGEEGEDELAQSAITVRCLTRPDGSVPDSDTEPELIAYVARSY